MEGLRKAEPWGCLSSSVYKNFISWLKGSWLCLCAIGPFRDTHLCQSMDITGALCMTPFSFPMALRFGTLAGHPIRA
jgi:hypothetical protein